MDALRKTWRMGRAGAVYAGCGAYLIKVCLFAVYVGASSPFPLQDGACCRTSVLCLRAKPSVPSQVRHLSLLLEYQELDLSRPSCQAGLKSTAKNAARCNNTQSSSQYRGGCHSATTEIEAGYRAKKSIEYLSAVVPFAPDVHEVAGPR
jgi:hypothetical protein